MAIIPADEKVFMVDKRTNTTYGGSQALQDMQQWYTMQDISDSVQPYKVFTALLTQSGGDSPISNTYENLEPLIIGRSYLIDSNNKLNVGGTDFTNVGAPNNDGGTWFIATGTTPIWGTSNGVLTSNEGTPVATVLENTIGNIWFTYDSEGNYTAKSTGLFLLNKTATFTSTSSDPGNPTWTTARIGNENQINITSFNNNGEGVNNFTKMVFEIRVYND